MTGEKDQDITVVRALDGPDGLGNTKGRAYG